jgi:Holliday junction resolvasome RuvABC ATP-dependent DNA helicase subunit
MISKELPRSWKVQDRIKDINKQLKPETLGSYPGVQQSVKERLAIRIETLSEKS